MTIHMRPPSGATALLFLLASTIGFLVLGCERGGDDRSPSAPGAAAEAMSWVGETDAGHFVVRVEPRAGKAPLRELHEWTVQVTNAAGETVRPSRLTLGASMEQHGHGMETRPTVLETLPDGRHVVGGMKFNMSGEWQIRVDVADGATADRVRFDVEIGP